MNGMQTQGIGPRKPRRGPSKRFRFTAEGKLHRAPFILPRSSSLWPLLFAASTPPCLLHTAWTSVEGHWAPGCLRQCSSTVPMRTMSHVTLRSTVWLLAVVWHEACALLVLLSY